MAGDGDSDGSTGTVGDEVSLRDGSWSKPKEVNPDGQIEVVGCLAVYKCLGLDPSGRVVTLS